MQVAWQNLGGILGGVGTFLIGMIVLTEGLRTVAGDALRGGLQRYTQTRSSALLSGAAVTAIVQSSSATTIATIGFVSAGLLSFPQSVAVIFGANLGTTSTGWLVSLVGLKLSLPVLALPLVGLGALTRLFFRGRTAQIGMVVAGFGLIFVGIGILQTQMEALAQQVDPASFPAPSGWGGATLVALGVAMTVLLQSSSAAVATTLTALDSGTLLVEQAAFLVVGQNLGTTVTAALASVGGSVPARRTAVAHILFNLITGAVALALLPFLLGVAVRVSGEGDPATAIAFFHSGFNLLGVGLLLPIVGAYSRMVEWLVREKGPVLTRHLDPSVARVPPIAVEAARRSAVSVARLLFARCAGLLRKEVPMGRAEFEVAIQPAQDALAQTRRFLASVRTSPAETAVHDRHLNVLHALDHIDRFIEPLGDLESTTRIFESAEFVRGQEILSPALEPDGPGEEALPALEVIDKAAVELARLRKEHRANVLQSTAVGGLSPDAARNEIEAMKRMDRFAYHGWRAVHHLRAAEPVSGREPNPEGEERS